MVREDLPRGTIGAQVRHATRYSSVGVPVTAVEHAVVLMVPDEEALLDLERRLLWDEVYHVAIREPDPPFHNALMAIGFPPQPRENLRPMLKHLPLLR